MFFQKIRGHTDVLSNFKKWVIEDSFEGVYLLSGPKGIGKYTIASRLAKYILCNGLKDDSCKCKNCSNFLHSPDYLELGSEEDSSIKVADAQAIENFVSLLPFKSKKRVILIDNADNITTKAANRLLKALEGVKPHVVFFMVSSHPEDLIPTVRSRATEIKLDSLSREDIISILKSQEVSDSKIEIISNIIPYLVTSPLLQCNSYVTNIQESYDFLKKFSKTDEDEIISNIKMKEENEELSFFIEMLLTHLNDLIKIHYDSPDVVFYPKRLEDLEKLTETWDVEMCVAFLERIRKIIQESKMNLNLKIYPRFRNTVSWIYTLMNSKQAKKNASK